MLLLVPVLYGLTLSSVCQRIRYSKTVQEVIVSFLFGVILIRCPTALKTVLLQFLANLVVLTKSWTSTFVGYSPPEDLCFNLLTVEALLQLDLELLGDNLLELGSRTEVQHNLRGFHEALLP